MKDLSAPEYDAILRSDFWFFAQRCFCQLNPQTTLATNWHLEVIAAKLTAVREGKIRRLIINVAPRNLKSLLASIAFPAWCLGHDPSAQILCVSYAQDLADKLARDCRSIVMSPWYRQIFPTRLAPHRQAVQEFITTRQGYRLATSTGGVLTGRGADIILIDDPLKPEEALSDAQRKAANEWYDHTLYSRLNDKRHGAIVIIMQRLHEDDLVGHVLAQEGWEVLSFPAIAEADEEHRIETIWAPRCFRRRQGEALHPDREPLEVLDRIRRTIGEYNFAGQYQQSPAPLGGGLVKAEWFKRYRENERPQRFERIVQSWDTANKATELSDFSVCTTWGVSAKHLFLLGVFRRRLEYPALKRAVREQQSLFDTTEVLIEDKASGTQLIQELIEDGCHAVTRYQPTIEKTMRLNAQTGMIESGFVHIPEAAPWLAEYLHEMTVFPNGKHDDQVDSTAQFLDWLKRPFPGQAFYEFARMQAERYRNPENPERFRVLLEGPIGTSVQTLSGRHVNVASDGTLELSADDAQSLIRAGWRKLGEWIEDEPIEDEQIEKQSKPEDPKVTYAVGSMEWQAEQQQKEISRIEAEARREKRRLARVAMIMRAKSLNARSGEIARSSAGDSAHMGDPARAHCGSAPPG
jgi:predicted phage terminase large subunit-like protein